MAGLRSKIASGFMYKFFERAGAQGISFLLSLLLARLLTAEDYGVISTITIIITILDVFVTYGFGNSLIAKKNSDSLDFSTCFYFGIVWSLILYAAVYFLSPYIAIFLKDAALTPIIRVMALRMPLAAINSVQHAYVSKHMRFKKFFYSTLIGTVVSGVVAVFMAFNGFGVWALVAQYLGNIAMNTVCLWIIVDWRPKKEFSFARLKEIYAYGWKILAVGLIDTTYQELRSLIIARKYSKADLAYYNRGNHFPSFGMKLIEPTVNTVLFPTLAQCNDDAARMKAVTRKIIQLSTYIIAPIMIGLAVVAEPLVVVLLTEKWLPCVVFLQIGCLSYLFRPLQFINNTVIKSSGRSDLLLKLDIVKKGIGVALLLYSMQYGVVGIAVSQAVSNLIATVINIAPNRKILNYGYGAQLADVGKNLLLAVVMGAAVYPIAFLAMPSVVTLILQIAGGVAIYLGGSVLLKLDSFTYGLSLAKSMLKKQKGKKHEEV